MTYYNVFLWSGAGYTLDKIEVMADCEEQALDLAVVQIEKQGKTGLFFDDCEEIEKMEEQGLVLYIDATMEGASAPHYIDAQNLRIEAAKRPKPITYEAFKRRERKLAKEYDEAHREHIEHLF